MKKAENPVLNIADELDEMDSRQWPPHMLEARRKLRIFMVCATPTLITSRLLFGAPFPFIFKVAMYAISGLLALDIVSILFGLSTVALLSNELPLKKRFSMTLFMFPKVYFKPVTPLRAMTLAMRDVELFYRENELTDRAKKLPKARKAMVLELIERKQYDAAEHEIQRFTTDLSRFREQVGVLRARGRKLPCADEIERLIIAGEIQRADGMITRVESLLQSAQSLGCTAEITEMVAAGGIQEADTAIMNAFRARNKRNVIEDRLKRIRALPEYKRPALNELVEALEPTEFQTHVYRKILYALDGKLAEAEESC